MIRIGEKRNKIFYVPGMISLVLIPVLCYYHFYKIDAFKVYGSLDISLVPNKEEFEKYKVKDLRKYKDDIYVLTSVKSKHKQDHRFICGTIAYSRENTLRMEEENKKKELHIFQVSFLREQWIIFLGYLGIVFLNIFALVKFNKNK